MKHGAVVHFEIKGANDPKIEGFYSTVFGWKFMDWPMGEGEMYRGVGTREADAEGKPTGDGINGGMMKDDAPVGSVVVINVDDMEKALADVKANGGEVMMGSQEVGDFGLYALVKDPNGTAVGMWQDVKKEEG